MADEEDDGLDWRDHWINLYEEHQTNVSSLSLGDQSYIMDLANQKEYREERRQEEALEDALDLYKAALSEGAPKSVEFFKTILGQVLSELNEEYHEKDRLQDEWLEAALQEEIERHEREEQGGGITVIPATISSDSGEVSFDEEEYDFEQHQHQHDASDDEEEEDEEDIVPIAPLPLTTPRRGRLAPPRTSLLARENSNRMLELDQKIHDEDRKILEKKLKKCTQLMDNILKEKGLDAGRATKRFKQLKKKAKEYTAALDEAEAQAQALRAQKDKNKCNSMDATNHTKGSSSAMYDWGATSTHTHKVADAQDDSSSGSTKSSTSGSQKSTSSSSDDDAEADLAWAKSVVAKLRTKNSQDDGDNDNDNDEKGRATKTKAQSKGTKAEEKPNLVNSPAKPKNKKKATPHKNASFNTTRATTRQLKGSNYRPSLQKLSNTRPKASSPPMVSSSSTPTTTSMVGRRISTVTEEEGEDEPTPKPTLRKSVKSSTRVSSSSEELPTRRPGSNKPTPTYTTKAIKVSQSAPPTTVHKTTKPPSKRKSPSWKAKTTESPVSSSTATTTTTTKTNGTASKTTTKTTEPTMANTASSNGDSNGVSKNAGHRRLYTLKDFQEGKVPEQDLDMVHWETYLIPEEFERHFAMSKEAFGKLPKWKKLDVKRRIRTW